MQWIGVSVQCNGVSPYYEPSYKAFTQTCSCKKRLRGRPIIVIDTQQAPTAGPPTFSEVVVLDNAVISEGETAFFRGVSWDEQVSLMRRGNVPS